MPMHVARYFTTLVQLASVLMSFTVMIRLSRDSPETVHVGPEVQVAIGVRATL